MFDFAADGRCPPSRRVRRTSVLVLMRLKVTCSGFASWPSEASASRPVPGPFRQLHLAPELDRERRVVLGNIVAPELEDVAPGAEEPVRAAKRPAAGCQLVDQQVETAGGVQGSVRGTNLPGDRLEPSPRAATPFDESELDSPAVKDLVLCGQFLDCFAVAFGESTQQDHQRREVSQVQKQVLGQLDPSRQVVVTTVVAQARNPSTGSHVGQQGALFIAGAVVVPAYEFFAARDPAADSGNVGSGRGQQPLELAVGVAGLAEAAGSWLTPDQRVPGFGRQERDDRVHVEQELDVLHVLERGFLARLGRAEPYEPFDMGGGEPAGIGGRGGKSGQEPHPATQAPPRARR